MKNIKFPQNYHHFSSKMGTLKQSLRYTGIAIIAFKNILSINISAKLRQQKCQHERYVDKRK